MDNNKQQPSEVMRLRKMKFQFALPVLVLPFLTFMFMVLGGGKKAEAKISTSVGFNMQLPEIKPQGVETLDKMSYYKIAEQDSAKMKREIMQDPYLNGKNDERPEGKGFLATAPYAGGPIYPSSSAGSAEDKVYKKLAELNAVMEQKTKTDDPPTINYSPSPTVSSNDLKSLEKMMAPLQTPPDADPEMVQIDGMLDKILDIQHPDRINNKLRKTSLEQKNQAFVALPENKAASITVLSEANQPKDSVAAHPPGFYSLETGLPVKLPSNAIPAVVHQDQTIVSGATIKLRVTASIFIAGKLIPNGSFVYGTATINGERLEINISSIQSGGSLYPVNLSAYDLDGIPGIYIPGAISRDVSKESADRAVQGIGMASLDPSLGAQAANAGIEAAKSLLSKKVKLIRVNVKAGYQILLRDTRPTSI
ncbi:MULTISPECIES: conjugative transposon protein TraM [Chitinophagaceae]